MLYILNHSMFTFGVGELIALIITVALIITAVVLLTIQRHKTEELRDKVAGQSAEKVVSVRETIDLSQQNL